MDNDYQDYYYNTVVGEPAGGGLTDLRQVVTTAGWWLAALLLIWLAVYLWRRYRRSHQHLKHILLRVRLVKEKEVEEERMSKKDIAGAEIAKTEALIEAIGGLKAGHNLNTWLNGRADIFSLEIVCQNGQIDQTFGACLCLKALHMLRRLL